MDKRILAHTALIVTILIPVFIHSATVLADTTDPSDWYRRVDGVLSSDYYFFYPYKAKDLKIGFSKFGEMIYSPLTAAAKQGLRYDGTDPFTASPDQNKWQSGWLIRISYTHADWGDRVIWAYALFSDKKKAGSPDASTPWLNMAYGSDPRGTPNGGRKTNGYCETEDIVQLYKGPRSESFFLKTHIYDDFDNIPSMLTKMPLVDLVFTVEFNKVEKEFIVKQDVILKAPFSSLGGDRKLKIDFSDRGEWNLGPAPNYTSYAYFYTQGTRSDGRATLFPTQWRDPPLYGTSKDTVADGRTTKYKSPTEKCTNWHWPGIDLDGRYDVAQIISSDRKYVGWQAFWPMVQYWSVYGSDFWFQALSERAKEAPWGKANAYDTYNVDDWCRRNNLAGTYIKPQPDELPSGPQPQYVPYTEPSTPYIIGEWSFTLTHPVIELDRLQFRGVTVYGVTDWNDGTDFPGDANNTLDREAVFQLDEVFNPFDLRQAVLQQTSRMVEFKNGTGTQKAFTLSMPMMLVGDLDWDKYYTFAERILVGGVLKKRLLDYTVTNPTTITFVDAPPSGSNNIKITYSVEPKHEKVDYIKVLSVASGYYHPLTHISKTMTIEVVGKMGTSLAVKTAHYEKVDSDGDGFYDSIKWKVADPEYGDAASTKVAVGDELKVVYEVVLGTYEWVVIGKEAGLIDSTGAAFVAEAFESIKNIEVRMAGMDMKDLIGGLTAPCIFYRFVAGGGTRVDYREPASGRSRLNDDFCTRYAIETSSIIYVGGPIANLGAEYVNDFLPLFWGMQDAYHQTDVHYRDRIVSSNCWLHPKETWSIGHALIGVCKDISGTVHLTIWGVTGEDTYWASYWLLRERGVMKLQELEPGVVGVILKMTYGTACIPSISIVHKQGTISCKCPVQTLLV